MRSWTAAEETEGRRLATGGMTPAEVYMSLAIARCERYERALTAIAECEVIGGGESLDAAIDLARTVLE